MELVEDALRKGGANYVASALARIPDLKQLFERGHIKLVFAPRDEVFGRLSLPGNQNVVALLKSAAGKRILENHLSRIFSLTDAFMTSLSGLQYALSRESLALLGPVESSMVGDVRIVFINNILTTPEQLKSLQAVREPGVFGTVDYNNFTNLVNIGGLKGKNLIGLCLSNSLLNDYCDKKDQSGRTIFHRLMQSEFGLMVPAEKNAREIYIRYSLIRGPFEYYADIYNVEDPSALVLQNGSGKLSRFARSTNGPYKQLFDNVALFALCADGKLVMGNGPLGKIDPPEPIKKLGYATDDRELYYYAIANSGKCYGSQDYAENEGNVPIWARVGENIVDILNADHGIRPILAESGRIRLLEADLNEEWVIPPEEDIFDSGIVRLITVAEDRIIYLRRNEQSQYALVAISRYGIEQEAGDHIVVLKRYEHMFVDRPEISADTEFDHYALTYGSYADAMVVSWLDLEGSLQMIFIEFNGRFNYLKLLDFPRFRMAPRFSYPAGRVGEDTAVLYGVSLEGQGMRLSIQFDPEGFVVIINTENTFSHPKLLNVTSFNNVYLAVD